MTHWERAFTELVRAREGALLRYAYLLCGDHAEAADLVQEGLLRAFQRTRLGSDLDRVEAYVRAAILRCYVDGWRRQARWRRVRHLFLGSDRTESADHPVVERDSIRAALSALSPRQRACVVLRFYEDLPVADIAAQLGCGEGTVKRHLSEALARLAPHVEVDSQVRADSRVRADEEGRVR
jgi:RNA polymerase sigma-70 factor (ECF subfamily)